MVWWKKNKDKEPKIDALKDIQAILDCLKDLPSDGKLLVKDFQKLEELEKEKQVGKESILHINLEAQAKILDQILQRYEFLQNDIDINGIRVKQIAHQWLQEAQHVGLRDLVKKKKQDMKWRLDW